MYSPKRVVTAETLIFALLPPAAPPAALAAAPVLVLGLSAPGAVEGEVLVGAAFNGSFEWLAVLATTHSYTHPSSAVVYNLVSSVENTASVITDW